MSVARNATYNLIGMLLPLAITLVTIPFYLMIVGIERYGLLALCWVMLGYLGFLDLGLGPAIAQKIAASQDAAASRNQMVWTALWASLALGGGAAIILRFTAEAYLQSLPSLHSALVTEIAGAMPMLAIMAPVILVSSVLSGALHGRERFLEINLAGCLGSSLMSLLPLLAAYYLAPTLPALIFGALAARIVSLSLLFALSSRVIPLTRPSGVSSSLLVPLLRFGGWVSLTSIAVPLLMTVDRLIIGASLGAAAVALYSIPFGLVSRLIILPVSLSSALFPRFAHAHETERRRLMRNGVPAVASAMTPIIVALMILVHPFFSLWIGPGLADRAAQIAYLLGAGVWANCIAQIPLALLQGSGRPDLVSKLLLAEVLPYWTLLLLALWLFGLPGAAAAWTTRMVIDCILLCRVAGIGFPAFRFLLPPALIIIGSSAAATALQGVVGYGVLVGLFSAALTWSAFHVPEAMRARLGRWEAWLPAPRSRIGDMM